MSPEELAAILADHAGHWGVCGISLGAQEHTDNGAQHCPPYCLAAELTAERAKVERVEALVCMTVAILPAVLTVLAAALIKAVRR